MYDEGYVNTTNIDFSSVVIESMAARNDMREKMKCTAACSVVARTPSGQLAGVLMGAAGLEMDMMDMRFEDASFDVAIEKGTLDAILVRR